MKKMGIFLKIVIGDSENGLKEVETCSVQLTVTSPPYFRMKGYVDYPTYSDYMKKMRAVFNEVYRVTEEGRVCAVNVCDYIDGGHKYPLVADFTKMLQGLGFTYEDCIIWAKPFGVGRDSGSAGSRAGNFIKYGNPLYFKPNNTYEGIIIMRKGEIDYKKYPKVQIDYRKFYEFMGDVWHMSAVSGSQFRFLSNHPAPFPYQLPYNLVNLYSLEGELVIDPFCGTGTTLKAAKESGRSSIGFELNKFWLPQIKSMVGFGDTNLKHNIQYDVIEIGGVVDEPPEEKKEPESGGNVGVMKWMQ